VSRRASQKAGLDRTLRALQDTGRLSGEHEALVALAKGLAAALDEAPENAALWREYRAVVATVAEAGTDDPDDDTKRFLFTIRTPGL
jgi:hypothetical protein